MKRQQKAGFTVVETLIVLAISSVLFLSVAALISGQLNRFRTRDAVFNLEQNIRDVSNDVSTGYYPQVGSKFTCTNANPPVVSIGVAGENRGENQQCVIAGKKIEFTDNEIISTPVVVSSSTTLITSTLQLTPITQLSEIKKYEWGIKPLNAANQKTYYILNKNYNTSNITGASGGQSVVIYGVQGNSLSQLPGTTSNFNLICFVNGGQNSSITLGKGNTVAAEIKSSCT